MLLGILNAFIPNEYMKKENVLNAKPVPFFLAGNSIYHMVAKGHNSVLDNLTQSKDNVFCRLYRSLLYKIKA